MAGREAICEYRSPCGQGRGGGLLHAGQIMPHLIHHYATKALQLAALAAILWAVARFGITPSPQSQLRAFRQNFTTQLAQSRPALAEILRTDPGLNDLFITQLQPAWQQGGWPEALRGVDRLAFQNILYYASDHQIAQCDAAWRTARTSIAENPTACRLFRQGSTNPLISAEIARANQACIPALQDGANRRRAGQSPRTMPLADFAAAYRLSLASPTPLSASERAALQGSFADDQLSCAAALHRDSNLAALPEGALAAYRRREYALGTTSLPKLPAAPPTPPVDFHCPAPGTKITISFGTTSQTLRARPQKAWDCPLTQPDGTQFPLWSPANPLPHLWPLAVGKTVTLPTEEGSLTARILSRATYSLPTGWVTAYLIQQSWQKNGTPQTQSTYYAPDLGLPIAQSQPPWQLLTLEK